MKYIDFENKKILVAGASSGIGRATAILLSQLNARVILTGRNEKELNNTLKLMENQDKHIILPFDINDHNNYKKYLNECIKDGEKVKGLVYSIGIGKLLPLRVINEKDIDDIFNTNIKSFLIFLSALSKSEYSDSLSVVVISSMTVHYPYQANIIFSASKGAVEAAILGVAVELAKKKGRINTVIPNYVKTNLTKDISEDKIKMLKERSLLDLTTVDDVADAVAFLLSDRAKCITGRSLFVDSGYLGQFC